MDDRIVEILDELKRKLPKGRRRELEAELDDVVQWMRTDRPSEARLRPWRP
ncbi:hypothetical protein AKJ09_09872 [Labilithrix luteola]|uniref:Uncharacterized protein n=1 Tax=Labilithrix luteola TaxID=1391654 RepID=A0A0K1QBU6_9BACT|nr:hypothetical protein AKJ09_09872 [Labilithrix luteola]